MIDEVSMQEDSFSDLKVFANKDSFTVKLYDTFARIQAKLMKYVDSIAKK